VPALHSLRGETLPALGATALQDRATRARRHARAETVATLPPAHVGLIRPFHEVEEGGNCPKKGRWSGQYRSALLHRVIHSQGSAKCLQMWRTVTVPPQVWRVMWSKENPCKSAGFLPQFPRVVGGSTRWYARRFPQPERSRPAAWSAQLS
jgi:hypothetical protein